MTCVLHNLHGSMDASAAADTLRLPSLTHFFSSPSLQNKDPGGGVGSTSRGWRLVGLGVGVGGFRDQGVETGRFRSM